MGAFPKRSSASAPRPAVMVARSRFSPARSTLDAHGRARHAVGLLEPRIGDERVQAVVGRDVGAGSLGLGGVRG